MPTGSTVNTAVIADASPDVVAGELTSVPRGVLGEKRTAFAPYDRAIYTQVATALTDKWLNATHPSPWVADQYPGGRQQLDARSLCRKVSVALAVGLRRELNADGEDRAHMFEFVRCSLNRWQASLLTDGRPASRSVRREPLAGVIFGQVVRLLGETRDFQTPLLLADMERCSAWVGGLRPQTPWIESATICALAEAAPLVRDSSLLKLAQHRLGALLERQDEEGWFSERGGANLGCLSLTIDSLARLQDQTGWALLEKPLRRAVGFLARFVPNNASADESIATYSMPLISPYGVELLAGSNADAAELARHCRQRLASKDSESFFGHDDDAQVTLGVSVCLAAIHARADVSSLGVFIAKDGGWYEFPSAGLATFTNDAYHAVVDYKRGGAIQISWRSGQPALIDPGLTICRSRKTRGPSDNIRRSTGQIVGNLVTCSGSLPMRMSLVRRVGHALGFSFGGDSGTGDHPKRRADRFVRKIEFLNDRVMIRDEVKCHGGCQSVVCQSPLPVSEVFPLGSGMDSAPRRKPIFIEGGRYVQLERVYRDGQLLMLSVTRDRPDTP